MAKLSINLQGRAARGTDSTEHGGTRLSRWEDDKEIAGDLPKTKVKSLLANQTNQQNQGAVMPHDYIDKMHVSKSNWLGRMERGRER